MTLRKRLTFAGMAVVIVAAIVALDTPVRALTFPATLARDVALGGREGRVSTALPPTHIAFSWTGADGDLIRYRTVADGAASTWHRARESHDMEAGDRHFSAIFVVDRPDAIEWDVGSASVTAVTLHEINTLDGPSRTVEVPYGAAALAATPDIVTRAEWGADESIRRSTEGCEPRFHDVQQLFVHHTAGTNGDPDPAATMRAIYWFHVRDRGWCDIGYNFVIGSDGAIYEARRARSFGPWETHDSENRKGRAVTGAHVAGYNAGSVGTSLMGNYENVPLPRIMRDSLVQLLAWEADRHNLPPAGKHTYRNPESGQLRRLPYIAGHRDAGETACPGRRVYNKLDDIRAEVQAIVGPGRTSSHLAVTVSAQRVPYGDAVTFSGVLADESGAPLAGRTVTLYKRAGGGAWRVSASLLTGPAGDFSTEMTPRRNRTVVAAFSGDESVWESDSKLVRIGVKPRVRVTPEGGVRDPDGVYWFDPDTTTVRLVGEVDPAHAGRRVTVEVSKQRADGTYRLLASTVVTLDSNSAYRYRFVLPAARPSAYRAVTRFPGDDDHLAASSRRVRFAIASD
jgi:hypothetical protein